MQPVSVSAAAPFGLHVDPQDRRGQALIAAGGMLNPNTHAMWHILLASGSWTHVVDAGANYGEMLLKAPLPPGATIIAFEPNLIVLPYLMANLSEAGINATVVACALSDRQGSAALLVDREWSGKTRLAANGDASTSKEALAVSTTTLEAALGGVADTAAIRLLLKIDVEGQEAEVLQGLGGMLEGLGDFAALVEVLWMPTTTLDGILDRFEVELYEPATKTLVPFEAGRGKRLSDFKTECRFYPNDIVLRRKRAA